MITTISVRTKKEDKIKFETICKSIGITASAAIKIFIKETINKGEIPFKIRIDPFYSKTNQERLRQSIKELEETGGTIHDIDLD